MLLVEDIVVISVFIILGNVFQLVVTTKACEENKPKQVKNVVNVESLRHLFRVEVEIFGLAENWWEASNFLAETVHH